MKVKRFVELQRFINVKTILGVSPRFYNFSIKILLFLLILPIMLPKQDQKEHFQLEHSKSIDSLQNHAPICMESRH